MCAFFLVYSWVHLLIISVGGGDWYKRCFFGYTLGFFGTKQVSFLVQTGAFYVLHHKQLHMLALWGRCWSRPGCRFWNGFRPLIPWGKTVINNSSRKNYHKHDPAPLFPLQPEHNHMHGFMGPRNRCACTIPPHIAPPPPHMISRYIFRVVLCRVVLRYSTAVQSMANSQNNKVGKLTSDKGRHQPTRRYAQKKSGHNKRKYRGNIPRQMVNTHPK